MSSNDIDEEESISTSSSEITSDNKQQKTFGRPFNPVWNHFNQIEKKKADIIQLVANAQFFYFKQLTEDNDNQNTTKKRKTDSKNKEDLLKYVENQELTSKRQEHLENSMCLAFICAGISFNTAENKIVPTLVAQFFKASHIANSALENEIQINNIVVAFVRLAYFLHPKFKGYSFKRGQYKKIAKYASTLWKALGNSESSCQKLLEQLASYKVNESPFNDPFESDCQTPQIYELTLEDILIVANETRKLDNNDSDEDSVEDYVEDSEEGFESFDEILKLEEAFDFDHEIFRENSENNNIRLGSEDVVEENPNYNYNIDSLVDEIFI
ncbi:2652_t:CDS:2 [Scutellospora calospora]|uniref:2652_t:CDS:1 n=1 Tax=Scutellospora calospora TaxID=85575 RepID=A0ACA9JV36_9GLOM|nr:2652_t:CDS:2 [Scutellospora calospora]